MIYGVKVGDGTRRLFHEASLAFVPLDAFQIIEESGWDPTRIIECRPGWFSVVAYDFRNGTAYEMCHTSRYSVRDAELLMSAYMERNVTEHYVSYDRNCGIGVQGHIFHRFRKWQFLDNR